MKDFQWRTLAQEAPQDGRIIEIKPTPTYASRHDTSYNVFVVTNWVSTRSGERAGLDAVIRNPGYSGSRWPDGHWMSSIVTEWRYTRNKRYILTPEAFSNFERTENFQRLLYKGRGKTPRRNVKLLCTPHQSIVIECVVNIQKETDVDKIKVLLRERMDDLLLGISNNPLELDVDDFDHNCEGCSNVRAINEETLKENIATKFREILDDKEALKLLWDAKVNDAGSWAATLLPWLERMAR